MPELYASPLGQPIFLSAGSYQGHSRWWRTQRFGCTGFDWEPPLGGCPHFHRAIDIARGAAGEGDPLYAAGGGRVLYSGTLNDGAKAIVIDEGGGVWSGYGHLATRAVSQGAQVGKGKRIGTVGSTGQVTGPHLHWARKRGMPAGLTGVAAANAFWLDPGKGGRGDWTDPWPFLEQNVRVRPRLGAEVNIRASAGSGSTPGAIYATSNGDVIRRASDGAVLGEAEEWRDWGGTVSGASYTVSGKTSNRWHRIQLGGAWRYVAVLVSELNI